ncbi:MAG TPA: hypothetical protein VMO47_06715, partial [Rhodothermales bacterium]|nr:hypothetical protein [Rhodothermales bacterium]
MVIRIRPCRGAARTAVLFVLSTLLISGLSACEEDVTAVVGTELSYSIYGVISPQLDSQWVRVYPIEARLIPARPELLDATVASTDFVTGERYEWRDSVIVDFADQYAHVFWAPFQAQYAHTYRIEVRRSDGASASAEVTVPRESEVTLQAPKIRVGEVILPVLIPGDIPRVLAVEVDYVVAYRPLIATENVTGRVIIPYYTEPHAVNEGWLIPINLRKDFNVVNATIVKELVESINSGVGIILLNMTVRLIVGDKNWNPPNGRFDPELIVQPGVMTNVVGGFGFVGAGYRLHRQWVPPK